MHLRRVLVAATVIAVALTGIGASARPGDVDTTFGKRGIALVNLRGSEYAQSVDVAKNGTVVVAGSTTRAALGFLDFAVARLKSNGALDKSFSGDGKTSTDFGQTEIASSVAAAPGGKVVAAGIRIDLADPFAEDCCDVDLIVARYTKKGKLDPTFGDGGKVVIDMQGDIGQSGYVSAIAVQPDGKVIVGATGALIPPTQSRLGVGPVVVGMLIARLDDAGLPDPTFGTGGIAALNVDGAPNTLADLELQRDGSIVVAGTTSAADAPGFVVARLLSTGTLDPNFGPGGFVRTAFDGGRASAAAVAIHTKSGKITVAGSRTGARSVLVLARYLPDGSLDRGFSKDGLVVSGQKQELVAHDLKVAADGKPVAAARVIGACVFPCSSLGRLVRWKTNGAIDKGFGYRGVVDVPNPMLFAYGLALQGSRLLVTGLGINIRQGRYGVSADADFAVARIKL